MRLVMVAAATPYLYRSSPEQVLHQKASFKNRNFGSFFPRQDHGKIIYNHKSYMVHRGSKSVRATLESENTLLSDNAKTSDFPPPGCTRIKVELNKPLGIILEEDKVGNIFVAEVVKDGNADRSGLVDVGDQLIATSAIIYGTEDFYQGVKVRKGMQIVRLNVFGEKFETVMAAIGTHPAHVKVMLEIQKCRRLESKPENNGAAN